MPRTFRLLFIAVTSLRLQAKPADPPMTWNFPWLIDDEKVHVLVRDRIDASRGYARHLGVEVLVELPAGQLDDALERAHKLASLHLTLLSTVGRAATGPAQAILA